MILDGKVVAADIRQRLRKEVIAASEQGKRFPELLIITIGINDASKIYVRNKVNACNDIGIVCRHYTFLGEETTQEVIDVIHQYNKDNTIDGIMVQLPLPEGYDERAIIDAIDPEKDVDGLTTINIGRLRSGQPGLRPCTAKGIIDLCRYYDIELDGKNVTIIGRSNIVGKPLADMMMAEGVTVTQCHSHTYNISYHTLGADIVISAIGKPKYLGKECFDAGLFDAVIDVGMNRDENGKLCGDVDFDVVKDYTTHITPVPGGVGPMTVAELMNNVVECWRKKLF